jgi:long-chain acyl-CoA synthetase
MDLFSTFQLSANTNRGRIALQYENCQYFYQDVLASALAVAVFLRSQIGEDRQNIAFLMPNTPESVFALFGIFAAGYTAVPFNPNLTDGEIAFLLNHSDSPVLLYDCLYEAKAQKVVSLLSRAVTALSIEEILNNPTEVPAFSSPSRHSDDTALILYTSGTTGDPKGVMLTHTNIYSNYSAFAHRIGLESNQTLLAVLPVFHSFGITTILFGGLLSGARVWLFPKFVPQKVVQVIMSEPNIVIACVPPMLYMLSRYAPPDAARNHYLHSVISGGGPLPLEFYDAFKKAFQHDIVEGYGLTETSPVVAHNANAINKRGTIGPPLEGVGVTVRDEGGCDLPPQAIGELYVKGALIMKGYYKNPEATKAAFSPDGWFRTGDLALIDEDGYIQIVGRVKDLIVSGGENIYPREIEEHLQRYPGIEEVAVVGKPDALRAEVPYAFLVVNNSDGIDEAKLRNYCREKLASFKIPVGFTILPELPKTVTRKIKKQELRRLLVQNQA